MEHQNDKIFRAGAEARAQGHSLNDNPFGHRAAMEAASDETFGEWQSKYRLWQEGWAVENWARENEGADTAAGSM